MHTSLARLSFFFLLAFHASNSCQNSHNSHLIQIWFILFLTGKYLIKSQHSFFIQMLSGFPQFLTLILHWIIVWSTFLVSILQKSIRWIEGARLASLQLKVSQIADWWLKLMASHLQTLKSDLWEAWKDIFQMWMYVEKKTNSFLCISLWGEGEG